MRLPTINQYKDQIETMTSQMQRINSLQSQVSTGKKILLGSEDPVLADKLSTVEDFIQNIKGYDLSSVLSQNRNLLTSSVVQDSLDVLQKVQELVTNAQNGTLSNADRSNIAGEIEGYLEHIFRNANVQNNNGEYLFSGINLNVPPYNKNGSTYTYHGAPISTQITIGLGNSIPYNEVGSDLFNNPTSGTVFDVLQSLVDTLKTPANTQQEKDDLHQALDGQALALKDFFSGFIQYQNTLGNRGRMIEDQIEINKSLLINEENLLGKLGDADMGAVVSDLTQQLTLLEVTQQSYLKVQEVLQHFLQSRINR